MTQSPPETASMQEYVLPLESLARHQIALVGGKAANLGELLTARLPVPPGFCVTTRAYAAATTIAQLDEALGRVAALDTSAWAPKTQPGDANGGPDDFADAAATIRDSITRSLVPEDIETAIREAYAKLCKSAGALDAPVAVRSSATAEDLPGASFAGQQDSYLNIVGADAVVDAVRRCWASLWTDRAVAYRARNHIDPHGVKLAVVVQQQIQSDVAGVMFTANPITGRRAHAVIDASPGLGEAVVSGAVTPDHFVVDTAKGSILERRLGSKQLRIESLPGGGTRRVELSASHDN